MPRIEKKVVVKSKQGLHARPAAMFVQIANRYSAEVFVRRGEEEVNGKSIMGILMLGADKESEVVLIADGVDAEKVFQELENFLGKEEH
ncbi:MAG: HPr family phosphocarrier protein [Candidatus Omnitrophica bacterium]|nr:HPr family phosphocarrier protein [Candidatus Omnitrophota bacterium]